MREGAKSEETHRLVIDARSEGEAVVDAEDCGGSDHLVEGV